MRFVSRLGRQRRSHAGAAGSRQRHERSRPEHQLPSRRAGSHRRPGATRRTVGPLGLLEALGPVARIRPGLQGALLFETALGFAQPRAAALAGAQLLGQLVAAGLAVELVFGGVDRFGLFEDLARELLVVAVGIATGVRGDLRPVDRDNADLRQAPLRAEREDLAEQASDRVLVALDEPCDRRVIRPLRRCEDAEGDVLLAAALDGARRADPARA
jgi:hypothetical protein